MHIHRKILQKTNLTFIFFNCKVLLLQKEKEKLPTKFYDIVVLFQAKKLKISTKQNLSSHNNLSITTLKNLKISAN